MTVHVHSFQHYNSYRARSVDFFRGGGVVEPWKCANNHICANISGLKCANNHLCKHFGLKCANNHICANISASNVQTTTFVQTRHPQIGKSVFKKIHQPLMCKHDAVKCAKFQFWCEICKHPTNVQIVLFIKNQFTSTKLSIQMVD